MSAIPIKIARNRPRELVDALMLTELSPTVLTDTEKEWGPIRRAAAYRLHREGRFQELPEHFGWDWGKKSQNLELIAYRCFGIECDQKMQGLLMAKVAGRYAYLDPDKGKDLVYVEYLEAAPWNVYPLVDEPEYKGVGPMLMKTAVELSYDEGFHGRVGLHSLPQAEEFYRDTCGMHGCGPDPTNPENLPYYEMTRDIAMRFTSNSKAGGQ